MEFRSVAFHNRWLKSRPCIRVPGNEGGLYLLRRKVEIKVLVPRKKPPISGQVKVTVFVECFRRDQTRQSLQLIKAVFAVFMDSLLAAIRC